MERHWPSTILPFVDFVAMAGDAIPPGMNWEVTTLNPRRDLSRRVAGGEWYAESKRDWIICCPAFVQRGSGPSGGLGVFAFAVLERSLFEIAWSQHFLGGASLLWWVAGGHTAQVRQTCSTAIGRRPAISIFFCSSAAPSWIGVGAGVWVVCKYVGDGIP